MELSEVVSIFTNNMFSVAVAAFLLVRMDKTLKAVTDALNHNTEALALLKEAHEHDTHNGKTAD